MKIHNIVESQGEFFRSNFTFAKDGPLWQKTIKGGTGTKEDPFTAGFGSELEILAQLVKSLALQMAGLDPANPSNFGPTSNKLYYKFNNKLYMGDGTNKIMPAPTQGVAEGDKRPDYVVQASDKPKKVKPNLGGSSKHPYQGKLVGESQWGEPKDVLSKVLNTLEREVEWPLTDVMDPQQVKQLLSPLMQAVSQKLNSLDEAEVSNTDYEFTHGRKPGGQGSWFFVAHRGGINFSKDVEGEDYIQLNQMSYSDAKKAAIKWAKSKGHTSLFVAT